MHDVTGVKSIIPLHLIPGELSWSRLCRHWLHHGLSKRQLTVPPLAPEFACDSSRISAFEHLLNTYSCCKPARVSYRYAACLRFLTVSALRRIKKMRPMARPLGPVMGCLLSIHSVIRAWLSSLSVIQIPCIFDREIVWAYSIYINETRLSILVIWCC